MRTALRPVPAKKPRRPLFLECLEDRQVPSGLLASVPPLTSVLAPTALVSDLKSTAAATSTPLALTSSVAPTAPVPMASPLLGVSGGASSGAGLLAVDLGASVGGQSGWHTGDAGVNVAGDPPTRSLLTATLSGAGSGVQAEAHVGVEGAGGAPAALLPPLPAGGNSGLGAPTNGVVPPPNGAAPAALIDPMTTAPTVPVYLLTRGVGGAETENPARAAAAQAAAALTAGVAALESATRRLQASALPLETSREWNGSAPA
jgi:hypothetical protein